MMKTLKHIKKNHKRKREQEDEGDATYFRKQVEDIDAWEMVVEEVEEEEAEIDEPEKKETDTNTKQ